MNGKLHRCDYPLIYPQAGETGTSRIRPAQSGRRDPYGSLMVFGGGEQAAQDKSKAKNQVVVAAAARNGTHVIQQDDERTQNKQGEHQDRNPAWADFHVLGDWRGIAR